MTKNVAKIDIKLESMIQLINESEASELFDDISASVLANPTITWAKFILTDDKVNANRQRIPAGEFQNLILTGINMPIKMAEGEISPGHAKTRPIGVLTRLKEAITEQGNKAIVALAALWSGERPEDINLLKDEFKAGKEVNVSWEILYEDAVYNSEQDSMDLVSTTLKAATIVGNPAYKGRTQFLSFAAKKWSKAYIEELPKEHFLIPDYDGQKLLPIMDMDGKLDRAKLKEALVGLGDLNIPTMLLREKKAEITRLLEKFDAGASILEVSEEFYKSPGNAEENKLNEIEELKAKLQEVEAKLTAAVEAANVKEAAAAEKEATISTLQTDVTRLTDELKAAVAELEILREFKATKDAKAAEDETLEKIKAKFNDAGVTKEDSYFETNKESLLKLDDAALDLVINEAKTAEASVTDAKAKRSKIPALPNEDNEDLSDPKVLGKALRERKAKK